MYLMRLGAPGAEKPVARVDDEHYVDLSDVLGDRGGELGGDFGEVFFGAGGIDRIRPVVAERTAAGQVERFAGERIGAPITRPHQILAIGLNYRDHAAETGSKVPTEPILFTKSPNTLVGPNDDVRIPRGSTKPDWEVELGVVIGHRCSYLESVDEARAAMPDVEWIAADVRDPKSIAGLAKGADRMVIALGSNSFRDPTNKPEEVDEGGVARLAALAKAANLKHVVLVSSAGVTRAQPGGEGFAKLMYGVMSAKLRGEDALRNSGVPYTVLRPVGLWDKPPGQYGIALVPGDPPITAMISRSDVAAVAVHALVDPAARNKTVVILNVAQPQVDGWKSAFAAVPGP
jgi:hypothetical protein